MKTRAAVCRAFGAPLTIETVELAEPGPGEVLIRTAASAICHSDIFYIDGAWGGDLPAVYGHEAAGVVEAVGPNVTKLRVGDHVVATLIRNCGFCAPCAEGAPVFCEETFPLDRKSPLSDGAGKPIVHGLRTGAFAERMVVDQSQAIQIPKDMALDSAALIACAVMTGMGAVLNTAERTGRLERRRHRLRRRRPQCDPGRAHCRRVPDRRRRHRGRQARRRARLRRDREHQRQKRRCRRAGGGAQRGAQGRLGVRHRRRQGAAEQGVSLMKRNGATVLVGMPPSGVMATIDPGWLAAGGQRILGSKMGSARPAIDVPMIVKLYREGRVRLDQLISGRYRLEAINEALATSRSGAAVRNVIVF